MVQGVFPVVYAGRQNSNCFELVFKAPDMAAQAKAGQFVHILCDGKTLRRPISICRADAEKGTLRVVFEVRGDGTRWLSQRAVGDEIDVLGPLGNGFPLKRGKNVLVVGGGIGVPPLLGIADFSGNHCDAVLGFRDRNHLCLVDDFRNTAKDVFVMTDDGSFGEQGFVTQRTKTLLAEKSYDTVYACGPAPMLKAVSALAAENGVECYVSLEERMGCGIGACLVCACKIKSADGEKHLHVCKDGPVFKASEVVW